MTASAAIREGQVLVGPQFNERVRVVTARANGPGMVEVGVVGLSSGTFRQVVLRDEDLATIQVERSDRTYGGDAQLLRLGLQAYALGIAYEFDPYFGLSISRVDPLPHQLEAVYEYLLKLPQVRFLLADDAGGGKTIMAGLLLRELKLRGLIERVLIVCPSKLSFQWQRELKEKFDEQFLVLRGTDIREQFGINQWLERNQVITSLDLAKRDDILPGLQQVHWDLVVIDEAHHMSADAHHKTERYRLGELLRDATDHILLLTATLHHGDPVSFSFFLQRADGQIGRFADAAQRGDEGAKGLLAQADARHQELLQRRERRRTELERQRALTLQGVERIATALVLPHPERDQPEVRRLRPDPEVEDIAMRVAMEHESAQGRQVFDVHLQNLGYDLTSLDLGTGQLRLIEVKGLGAPTGTVLLTPNEKRVAEDRRDCYWLYVVADCHAEPRLEAIEDPARLPWHEVVKVDHYYLDVDAATRPVGLREHPPDYGSRA